MINRIIKKESFNYTITLVIFLLSISFLTKGSIIGQRNAGVAEAAANFKKIKLDNKNGKSIYEIEFIANKSRYEFIVDAKNGSIIKFEKR